MSVGVYGIDHHYRAMKKQSGFTLVEMMLTIALVSYVGLISVLFYSGFYLRNATVNAAKDIAFSLRQAQLYSISGRQGSSWGVAFTGDAIVLFKGVSYATRDAAFDESHGIPSTLAISGFTETVFSRMTGYPNATSTIGIAGAGSEKTITINAQGIVSQY